MKLATLFLLIFGIQGISMASFAADTCSSNAHQYAVDFCSKQTGADRSVGRNSIASDACYYGADYMEAHPQSTMQEAEQACGYQTSGLVYAYCQQGVWAYFRAAQKDH